MNVKGKKIHRFFITAILFTAGKYSHKKPNKPCSSPHSPVSAYIDPIIAREGSVGQRALY